MYLFFLKITEHSFQLNEVKRGVQGSEGVRIRCPKQVIEHDTDPVIKVWRNQRGREERI
jgi:hypothetical protein